MSSKLTNISLIFEQYLNVFYDHDYYAEKFQIKENFVTTNNKAIRPAISHTRLISEISVHIVTISLNSPKETEKLRNMQDESTGMRT